MNIIKNYIKTIIREVIEEKTIGPKFDKIVLNEIKTCGKRSVYAIMEHTQPTEITLLVEYIDPDSLVTCSDRTTLTSVNELYHHLITFKPKHPHFSGVHLSISVEKEGFGRMNVTDVIINSLNNKIYDSKDIQNVFEPMLKWLRERPELII